MKKFAVQSKKGVTSIVQLEVEIITPVEDPSIMWLKPGEYKVRILKPESFHMRVEKIIDGKKETILVPDVWFSHAVYDTRGAALDVAETIIKHEFEFNLRKYGTTYTNADVTAAIEAIKFVDLTA